MQKFEKFFEKQKIQEWRSLYIDYSLLKQMLKPFLEIVKLESLNSDKVNQALIAYNMYKRRTMPQFVLPLELDKRLRRIEDMFVQIYMADMIKCNQFFVIHIQQVDISMKKLRFNLLILAENKQSAGQTPQDVIKNAKNYYILRESTQGLYKEVFLLERFCHMNRQASLKIAKHYEEKAFFMENMQKNLKLLQNTFNELEIHHKSHSLGEILDDIETLYISSFSSSNPKLGIQVLKAEIKERVLTVKNAFLFGSFLGVSFCLFLMILLHRVEFVKNYNPNDDLFFPMFRGLSLFIFYFWLLACNVYIWEMTHINYKQIFRFNYHHSSVYQILKRISCFTMIFFIVFLLSLFREIADESKNAKNKNIHYVSPLVKLIFFPPEIGPIIIWSTIIAYFLMPTKKSFNSKGRRYFWGLLWQCLISIIIPMTFAISWCTDQFVSFVGPLKDVSYTICYYYHYSFSDQTGIQECGSSKDITSGLIIACFPLFLRMLQCIRQGIDKGQFFGTDNWYNFLKYTVSMVTAIFSYASKFERPFFYAWILSATISMVYSYYWDVIKDWKFFQPDTKYRFLRKQLAYDSPKFYYSIIIMNIILRMCWILSISPDLIHLWGQWFVYMISSLEIIRRFLWNFIRVEKEHVENVGQFRAVPKLIFPYETKLIKEQLKKLETSDKQTISCDSQMRFEEIINFTEKSSCLNNFFRIEASSPERSSTVFRPSLINLSPNGNDFYKDRFAFLREQEEKLLILHKFQDDEEGEEVFRATLGDFQKKIENTNDEQPQLVKKCKQEIIEIQLYIAKLKKSDVNIKETLVNQKPTQVSDEFMRVSI